MSLSASSRFRSLQRSFQLKVLFAVLFLLFVWLLIEYTSLLYRRYQIEVKKQWFIEENEHLARLNQELEQQYQYYQTEYFFRKEAKRKLNKKETGEKVMVISGGDEQIASPNEWEIRHDFFAKWKEYVFGVP